MKNNSNTYDIDGKLIRAIDDTHKMTVKEAQERVEYYTKKLEEIEENDPKYAVYTTYIRNLNKYILDTLIAMPVNERNAEFDRMKIQENTDKQIEKAINELKKEIEDEEHEENEESSEQSVESDTAPEGEQEAELGQTTTQADLLTEGEGRPETVMDEYVDFEEVK